MRTPKAEHINSSIYKLQARIAKLQRKLSLLEKLRDAGTQQVLKTGTGGKVVTLDHLHSVVKMLPTGRKPLISSGDATLLAYASRMKEQPTYPEQLFGERLTKAGIVFVTQLPVMNYIVDFYIPAYGLIIELDGEQHREQADYDRRRDTSFRTRRCHVWRIPNHLVNSFNVNEILMLPRVEWRIEKASLQAQAEATTLKPKLIKVS